MATTTFLERTKAKTCKACRRRKHISVVSRDGVAAVACLCGACVVLTGSKTEAITAWNLTRALNW